jgi:uncharacterized protein (TIGR03546 family)
VIRWIATIIVAINANSRAGEVAAGIAFALLLALIPAGNLLWAALFLLSFLLKVHLAAELLFLALFRLLVPLADALLDRLGYLVLSLPALRSIFTTLYNLPIVPLTHFNNTLVMGGLAAGIILWLPAFFAFRALVFLYRGRLRERLAGSRLVQVFRRIPLVASIASAMRKLGGAALSMR